MRALRYVGPRSIQLEEVPTPDVEAGEVLLKVGAAGACHSDLHIIEAPVPAVPTPLTLGHEIAGYVEKIGPGVTGWRTGDGVAVYGIVGCGRCHACLEGLDNQCRTRPPGGIGLSQDGGMADFVVVPASRLLPLGDLDPVQAAPLTDAGLTPYHAIRLCQDSLRPGSACVVIGIGGLGHMAVQLLAATTAVTIIAVDSDPDALERAKRHGAHHAFNADARAVEKIRALVGPPPGGAEVVLDFVGVDPTLELARSVVSTGGKLVLVGLGHGTLKLIPSVADLTVPMETTTVVPFWGTREELADVIALAQEGRIEAETEVFPLAQAAEAYERLGQRRVHGRAVVVP